MPMISRPGKHSPMKPSACASRFALVEDRHEHRVVDDQEIRIARRQPVQPPATARPQRLRHLQRQHLDAASIRRAQIRQPLAVLLQRPVVRIALALLHHGQHHVLADEARDVVDVAVGVVAFDALPEPEDGLDAEQPLDLGLDLLARPVRVAVLVEQAPPRW